MSITLMQSSFHFKKEADIALYQAAKEGDAELAILAIRAGADPSSHDSFGRSLLMNASACNHTATVRILIEAGADLHQQTNAHGKTALSEAVSRGHVESTLLLIQAGADIHAAAFRGSSMISLAITGGYDEVLRVLIQAGADVNAPPANRSEDCPLAQAALDNQHECLSLLIAAGAHLEQKETNETDTILYNCCYWGHEESVHLLLAAGANTEVRNAKDYTPLHAASTNGHTACVRLLLEFGADIEALSGPDTDKLNAWRLALINGHQDLADYIQVQMEMRELHQCTPDSESTRKPLRM